MILESSVDSVRADMIQNDLKTYKKDDWLRRNGSANLSYIAVTQKTP